MGLFNNRLTHRGTWNTCDMVYAPQMKKILPSIWMYRLAHYQGLQKQVLKGCKTGQKMTLDIFCMFTCMCRGKNTCGEDINHNKYVFQPPKLRNMCNITCSEQFSYSEQLNNISNKTTNKTEQKSTI